MHDESPRATRRDWAALWVLAIALALIVLDGTIVGVALPSMIHALHLDLSDAQWVNSLYSVVFAALLLTAGRLGDRWGRRTTLLIGVTTFVTGSVVAALAGSGDALIAARAVQGVGGALILPSTLSTVNAVFRGRDRAAAFGVWGAVMSGAAALGPLAGGWLIHVASWPWVFWVNVPIGVAVLAAAVAVVPNTRSSHAAGTDPIGPVLSALGFGLLVFGLIEGATLGWWAPSRALRLGPLTWPTDAAVSPIPVALLLGLLSVAAFWVVEGARARQGRPALLDTRLFGIPTFAWGNLTAALVAVGEFSLVFVLPLYLVTAVHLSTLATGFVLAGMAFGAFISGAAARHLAARLGAPRVVLVGLALEVLGAAGTAIVVGRGGGGWPVAATLLPYGLGLGLASAQLTSIVLGDVPVSASGAASAVQSTVRQVGAATGSAVAGAVLAAALGVSSLAAPPEAFARAASQAIWAAVVVLSIGLGSALRVVRLANGGALWPFTFATTSVCPAATWGSDSAARSRQ